jgi:galactokinase
LAFVPGEILDRFRKQFEFSGTPSFYRAPGRVNLIGEHTDYNLGYVFPIALEMACYVAIAPASHGKLRVYSRDFGKEASLAVADIATAKPTKQWSDYVFGVAQELVKAGFSIALAICTLPVKCRLGRD